MSVLVATLSDSPGLRRVLETVREQAAAAEAEILLVVNRAPDALGEATRAALAKRCDRLLFEPAAGKSRALNHGIAEARGEVVVFTDDDTEPQPGWLAALAAPLLAADRDPALRAAGGRVRPIYAPEAPVWFRAQVALRDTHFLGPRHELGCAPLDYPNRSTDSSALPLGANLAVRREVFETLRFRPELGPNRETGFKGGEETALCREILRAGGRIRYVAGALVLHPVPPERHDPSYVRAAWYAHGRETVRMRHALEEALPRAHRLQRRLWKRRYDALRARLAGRPVTPNVRSRAAQLEGMLHELRRLRAERSGS